MKHREKAKWNKPPSTQTVSCVLDSCSKRILQLHRAWMQERGSIRRTHIHEAVQEVCHRLNRNSEKRNHKLVCWETRLKIYIPNLANLWSKVMGIMTPPLKAWLWRGGEESQPATFRNKSRAPDALLAMSTPPLQPLKSCSLQQRVNTSATCFCRFRHTRLEILLFVLWKKIEFSLLYSF